VIVAGDVEMEGEVNVKKENDIDSEEDNCVGVNGEEGVYIEQEEQELDVDIKEEEIMDIKGEVSLVDRIQCCVK
jgi:hypothetical protein